ncbi:MAG TPA: TerB family tellurite resistance protein [Bacteroidales bacterium]
MGAIKWVGGVLGWAVGGPIGAVLGFAFGSMFDNAMSGQFAVSNNQSDASQRGFSARNRPQTQSGDFGVSLLMLAASVMKSDRQVVKAELDYVKVFFKRQFGQEKAENYILMLRELLKQNYDLRDVCMQIKLYMDHASRLQLLHFLFGLAQSDGFVHPDEIEVVRSIANWLGISTADLESIQAMFVKNSESAYKILGITPQAIDEEVKKAYKKMAVKYHPDKVSHLGEDIQKAANEKFKEVNVAYEQIKKERGMN